jgi:hypothetical protein
MICAESVLEGGVREVTESTQNVLTAPNLRRNDYDEARFVDWTYTRRQPGRLAVARASTPFASADAYRATSRGIGVLLQYPERPMLRQSLILRQFRPWLLV